MSTNTVNTPNTQESESGTVVAHQQIKYSHDKLGELMLLLLLMGILAFGLFVSLIVLFHLQSPPPAYFKASERRELIEELPLDKPNLPTNALLNWVTETMMEINTFNFVNAANVIEAARENFTQEGYDSYIKALKDAKVFDDVLNHKYVLRAQAADTPQITKEGVLANHYIWKIKSVMRFEYRNFDESLLNDAEITLLVMRVPTTQAPNGVKILKYDIVLRRPELK